MKLINVVKDCLQNRINMKNRKRLVNKEPTLICSNCTGGFLYHWLGLKFRSPFINLYLTPDDFIKALGNIELFLDTPIKEDIETSQPYPVGIGYGDVKIHFVHYKSFDEAVKKWEERKKRVDLNNVGVMLTNWGGENVSQLEKFDLLPFKHKVVFTDREFPNIQSAYTLRNYSFRNKKNGNIYATQNIFGKRYIDQFDYVSFINSLTDGE